MRLKFIKPQEPVLALKPPVSNGWLCEIKDDGCCTQIILDWAGALTFTRMGIDRLKRHRPVVTAAEQLKAKSFIPGGEMIAPQPGGRPNFHAMHSRMAWNAELLAFVACDILHKSGEDLRWRPAVERKAILRELIQPAEGIVQCSQHVEGGVEIYEAADRMSLEGIVSKRKVTPYRSGAKDAVWLKCWDIDFELIGIKRQPGEWTERLFARHVKNVGKAVIAKTDAIKNWLWTREQKAKAGPPNGVPTAQVTPEVEWVKPDINARVRTLRGEPKLRNALVQDLWEINSGGAG
ncbi:DNA ligase [Mesorhizobium sp. M7A.T.Ca.TU.009.01.3.2]|uniref:ATP-dependent DNA ligase n=1 Tax=unclassified Mesorhizobium TaxID=325217 RepID=UPI000FCB6D75|nr:MULTISPECIES: DNA ligase [unclassified Mesorhizobium]RUU24278.1 DNA ligase [Mesorhizobium sp. M7A.T.Ca.TU.009.01.3.2]RUV13062.1 DNA ligase [Mesorhizobium sp. M7A.T.Ca.TU.009.01.3.1]RUV51961.1 DNA ligase [Mesorhizobium sp. M7A.F.Ca.MR.228.00.0.0]RWN86245.1 MAG: DNA ligase [Mesorhizobium sp.]RUU82802.1 DNA ligase [Mesorhizobium sp. M7A.F.Ca.MR.362.00.0.0]